MLVLAIDTATPAITAGVVAVESATRGGVATAKVLAERITVNPRAHGELLTPHILAATTEAGYSLRDLDAITCGVGPGPYTGLRAGMVTAAALSETLGIPAYPVCTLDAIAATAGPGEPFLVVTDARRREVYWAAYDGEGARIEGPCVGPRADLPDAGRILDHESPSPFGIASTAAEALLSGSEPDPLTPLYLRRPDATEPGARKRVTT
ncbi:tRNA N6-adenosine(37)-N6-threonylcarbamoyltransferase complex dimerization subunit TsaB [Prauserella marina]|uniref:tRNA threonylcarbamoyl adenosine modification protein YeaZ n=1 Tax=Prauserella marina TaxID=530584 RepID=A0A222VJN5_9PSEU|nr:tRNA (adenosine(37)-N6)-threonylcarbamoyltransferase complex dimerization subunit type 1 TsaB [Prauserella marina]ASR34140.1 tRNA N6-adenosine(37)-N6-threonylcarbamoyltransferase complex dimerization subunit TsaB [Prauserella marina]PWV82788.1 tRNA threonylcarbamoyl adenosine modification protein YeaZ [Prauserella marina]SDC77288.1 tRNA threonylcarbamoyl adenosine modification protein YeaZ [Prauserella marina]